MKESEKRLIFADDDDDEERSEDEPDLIAHHDLEDIIDTQYKEVCNLKIEIDNNKQISNKCVMNTQNILNPKYSYISCNCPYCPELGDNICFECMRTCHKSHFISVKNIVQKSVNITNTFCSCAEEGHKRKELNEEKQEIFSDEKAGCKMPRLIGKSNIMFYYLDKGKNKFYCPFCRKNCMPEILQKVVPVPIEKLRKEDFHCSCKEAKYHGKKVDEIARLQRLFIDKRVENDICLSKVPGNLIKKNNFSNLFLSDLKVVYDDIKNSLLLEKKVRLDMTKHRYINEKYLNSIRLLKIYHQNIIINNGYEISNDENEFSALFNFEFVDSLFELFSNYKKDMTQTEINHSNDSFLIQLKIETLYFYRIFILIPKTKPFKKYGILSDTENITPFIRLMTKKHFDEFLLDLNVEKERFIEFVKNIWKTIERYDNNLMEYDCLEKSNADLIYEYLELLIILSSLRYTKPIDVSDFYQDIVIDSFFSMIKIVKKYKIEPKKLKKRIEEFVKYTILNYHDEIFYREVLSNRKKGALQTNSSATILNSTMGKKKTTERLSTTVVDLVNSNNSIDSNLKEQSKVSSQQLNQDMIEEDDLDDVNEQNEFNKANFMFESNPFSLSLLNSLFAFKKSTIDYNVEFQKWEIYDWLASKSDDFYMESIRAFYETYNKMKPESKLLLIHFRIFSKACFEINNSLIDSNQNIYKEILKANNKILDIYKNYFLNVEKPDTFCNKLIEQINLIKELYNNNFPIEKDKEQIVERKIFQIYFFKFRLLDNIYMIYNTFQNNNFLTKYLQPTKHEELITSIFELLSLFSYDNVIIAPILFSNGSLDCFLNLNKKFSNLNLRVKSIEIKYYLKWLKNFKQYNLKLNLVTFCKKLKGIYVYLEHLLSKKIVDKEFKLTQEKDKLGIASILKSVRNAITKQKKVKGDEDDEQFGKAKQDNKPKKKSKKLEMLNKKVFEKLKSEGECYFNLELDFTSDDLIKNILYIISCLNKCCSQSSEKSVLILNTVILDIIYKLYKSSFYYQVWEKYKKSLDDSSIKNKFGVPRKDVVNYKLNDFSQASLIDTNEKITEIENKLIIKIYKLLYKIDDYSFYLITDEIPKFEIKLLLQEKFNSMDFNDRRVLSSVYMRYYFISPFNILSNLNKLNMNSMAKLADSNINGAIISTSKEELNANSIEKKKKEGKVGGLFGKTGKEKTKKSKAKSKGKGKEEKEKTKAKAKAKEKTSNQNKAFKFLKRYKIVEKSLGLEPLLANLGRFKKLSKKFFQKSIVPKPYLFIDYFQNIILYPVVYSVYKLLYFIPVIISHYKYIIYKIILLFFECLRYFLETVIENNETFLENEKYKKMFKSLFIMKENENIEEIEKFMTDLIKNLSDLIEKIREDPTFDPLNTTQLLEYLCEYINHFQCVAFLPLKINDKNFRKEIGDISGREIIHMNNCIVTRKLNVFINYYEKLKDEGIENENNILMKLFVEQIDEDEPEIQQLKVNIILDLMFRMNFKNNEKKKIYPRGFDDSFILMNIINRIYKADPDLWHDCLVDISQVTKRVLHDIITSQLTFLIQFIYIDYHKLKDFNDNREGFGTEISAKNKFLSLIEFLRLFCENHHKIYQTVIIKFNINTFYLKNLEETLDLLNFILKIPTIVKNSIEYSNSKSNVLSIFKKYKLNDYYNEVMTCITDFLIEIIQGCFESNMKIFELPIISSISRDKKEKEKEKEKKQSSNEKEEKKEGEEEEEEPLKNKKSLFFGSINTSLFRFGKNREEKGNKEFEKYLETGYYCLDTLNNENDKLCLAQFFRFLICFIEEPFNPKINKERIIKMLNPKKLLSGLSECTINLYKQYEEVINENDDLNNIINNYNELLNIQRRDKDEIPEKFSDKLINLYLTNSEIVDNIDFIISSNIFRYLIMTSQYKSAEKVRQCLRELKLECDEDNPIPPEKNKNAIIGRREAYRFFSKIIKDVEIFYKPKDTLSEQERKKFKEFLNTEQYKEIENNFQKLSELKGDVQKVVFFVDPSSLFSQEGDINKFLENSPKNKNEKLNYLIEYMPTFKARIFMRKKLWKKKNILLNLLFNINYRVVIIISTILSLLVNILVLSNSFYILKAVKPNEASEKRVLLEENNNYVDYYDNNIMIENIKNRTNIITSMKSFLEEPENISEIITQEENTEEEIETYWVRQELNTKFIVLLTLINIIFIILTICNWLYFEFVKIEREEDEENEVSENKSQNDSYSGTNNLILNENKLNNDDTSFSIFDAFKKLLFSDIQVLVWNLLIGIIAILSINYHFLYSVQLFTMFILIDTMYTVIFSVQMRYRQFLSAGFLILIVSLFFAMIKYKWFTGPDECITYNECFFEMLNSGIRGGSGMGFGIKKLGQKGYIIEFFLEWMLFFIVMLILLNIINGIIVDTFLELREKSNEENETKLNICYICSLHRTLFEKRGIDFEFHKNQEHNIMNYFDYIYKVEITEESELNSLDYQVRQSIKNKRTDFFPVNTCVSFNSIKNDNN